MSALTDNPFAVLSLVAAPAVLTNASSVLALGTSNRFARAVDRARALSTQLQTDSPDDPTAQLRMSQLERVEIRSILLLRALTSFYAALGSFAGASLVTIVGASFSSTDFRTAFEVCLGLAVGTGVLGIGSCVYGCVLLVRETRMAVRSLRQEAQLIRSRHRRGMVVSPV